MRSWAGERPEGERLGGLWLKQDLGQTQTSKREL